MTNSQKRKRLVVIDANSLIHRAFHALPPLTTKKGEEAGAVYGFLLVLFKTIRELGPDFICACFDAPGPTFRHKKFEEYKAKRPPAPKELYAQIPKVKKILKAFNIPTFEIKGFEADDIIGTVATLAPRRQAFPEMETIILSGDLDLLQLIDEKTKVFSLKKGVKETLLYGKKEVQAKYGISPSEVLDFKALKGDPSDNIPGITGIGEKTAQMLLNKFGTLENLYKELEESSEKAKILKPKLRKLLLDYKEQAFLSKALAKIHKDVPIDFNLKKCLWEKYERNEVLELLKELGFKSLIKRLPELEKGKEKKEAKENNPTKKNLRLW
jgi:DNA polymerase-1